MATPPAVNVGQGGRSPIVYRSDLIDFLSAGGGKVSGIPPLTTQYPVGIRWVLWLTQVTGPFTGGPITISVGNDATESNMIASQSLTVTGLGTFTPPNLSSANNVSAAAAAGALVVPGVAPTIKVGGTAGLAVMKGFLFIEVTWDSLT